MFKNLNKLKQNSPKRLIHFNMDQIRIVTKTYTVKCFETEI